MLNFEIYFNYKSCIIFNSLIRIILCGVVLFFSFLYIGSISDKVIIVLLGNVDLLEFNDKVMVDKGFLIVDLLDKNKYF